MGDMATLDDGVEVADALVTRTEELRSELVEIPRLCQRGGSAAFELSVTNMC